MKLESMILTTLFHMIEVNPQINIKRKQHIYFSFKKITMTYLKIIVPIPSVVKISKSNECLLRPSIMWHDLTPFSIA